MAKITQSSKAMLLAIKVSTGTSRRKETPLLKIIMETYKCRGIISWQLALQLICFGVSDAISIYPYRNTFLFR